RVPCHFGSKVWAFESKGSGWGVASIGWIFTSKRSAMEAYFFAAATLARRAAIRSFVVGVSVGAGTSIVFPSIFASIIWRRASRYRSLYRDGSKSVTSAWTRFIASSISVSVIVIGFVAGGSGGDFTSST